MKLTKETHANLKALLAAVEFLADNMDRSAPLHNVQLFLQIADATANGEALEVNELQRQLGMTSSALSRALGAIGQWSYTDQPGLDLVVAKPDYSDRRRKPMTLTDKGEKLAIAATKMIH